MQLCRYVCGVVVRARPLLNSPPLSFISIRKNAENGVDGRAAICELRALLDEPVRAVCLTRRRSGHGRSSGAAMCFVCALCEQLPSRRAVIGPCICEPA